MEDKNLSKTLVTMRKSRGITQKSLASELNYSDKVISKWERGESLPDIYALKRLATFYNITLDDLVTDSIPFDRESQSDIINRELDVQLFKKPSKIVAWSILPIALLVPSTLLWGTIESFAIAAMLFGPILIVYGGLMSFKSWKNEYNNHTLIITNRPTQTLLFIDDQLVDRHDSIISQGIQLKGQIGDDTVKVYVTSIF